MNFLCNFHLVEKERDWEIKMQQKLFFSDSYFHRIEENVIIY